MPAPAQHAAQATRADFVAFVDDFKAKLAARQKARQLVAPAPAPAEPFDIEAARAELARLEARHDSGYQFAEDRAAYSRGASEAASITALRDRIARAEKAAALAAGEHAGGNGGAKQ